MSVIHKYPLKKNLVGKKKIYGLMIELPLKLKWLFPRKHHLCQHYSQLAGFESIK